MKTYRCCKVEEDADKLDDSVEVVEVSKMDEPDTDSEDAQMVVEDNRIVLRCPQTLI